MERIQVGVKVNEIHDSFPKKRHISSRYSMLNKAPTTGARMAGIWKCVDATSGSGSCSDSDSALDPGSERNLERSTPIALLDFAVVRLQSVWSVALLSAVTVRLELQPYCLSPL